MIRTSAFFGLNWYLLPVWNQLLSYYPDYKMDISRICPLSPFYVQYYTLFFLAMSIKVPVYFCLFIHIF